MLWQLAAVRRTLRDELHALMRRDATVFVFPSLHDQGCWVAAEAAAKGLALVCVQRGGPPLLARIASAVALQDLGKTAPAIARAIESMGGRTGSDSRKKQLTHAIQRHGLIPLFDSQA